MADNGYTARWSKARQKMSGGGEPSLSEGRGEKRSVEQGAGLTQKGVDKINRATGGNLQTAVTEKNPTGKRAARRRSFCARSKSWDGERGRAARRRWNC